MKTTIFIFLFFLTCCMTSIAKEHPFLFINKKNIAHAKQAIKESPEFAKIAKQIITKAKRADINSLPKLETKWWKKEKQKEYTKINNAILLKNTHIYFKTYGLMAKNLAYAHLLKPNEGFDKKAVEILMIQAEHPCEFNNVGSGLYYARPNLYSLEAYDILYDSFTPEQHKKIDAYFMRVLKAIKRSHKYWIKNTPGGPLNNHYINHKVGMAAIGLFYNKPELVKDAIYSIYGFDYCLRLGFSDGGIWKEGSLAYHFTQVEAMLKLAELTHNAGYPIDLYDYVSPDGRNIKQCYDVMIKLLLPNTEVPAIGDGYGSKRKLPSSTYELLYSRYKDPDFAWVIEKYGNRGAEALFHGVINLPKVSPPEMKTTMWFEYGLAALRTNEGTNYWNGNGWNLMASFGNNFIHHHADKLSILIFGDEHLWMPDAEAKINDPAKFSSDINQHFNWATLSHNTILIDMNNQFRSPKRPMDLIEFENLGKVKRITVADLNEQLYSGVKQLRTCIVQDDYILDVFQVDCDKTRDISWITHIDGESISSSCNNWKSFNLPENKTWSYIKNSQISSNTVKMFEENFEHKNKKFKLQVYTDSNAKIVRCGYPRSDRGLEFIPMRLIKIKGKKAIFVALYRKGKSCDIPIKVNFKRDPTKNIFVYLNKNGKTAVHRIPDIEFINQMH